MPTLSEFYESWSPDIKRLTRETGAKVEAGQDLSRFLGLEPKLRDSVDALCRDYLKSQPAMPKKSDNPEVEYLFRQRLFAAEDFAEFLSSQTEFEDAEASDRDWIEFLLIDSWHEVLVYKWRQNFSEFCAIRSN